MYLCIYDYSGYCISETHKLKVKNVQGLQSFIARENMSCTVDAVILRQLGKNHRNELKVMMDIGCQEKTQGVIIWCLTFRGGVRNFPTRE